MSCQSRWPRNWSSGFGWCLHHTRLLKAKFGLKSRTGSGVCSGRPAYRDHNESTRSSGRPQKRRPKGAKKCMPCVLCSLHAPFEGNEPACNPRRSLMREPAGSQSPDPVSIASETFPSGDRADPILDPIDLVPGKAGVIARFKDIYACETSIILLHNSLKEFFISLCFNGLRNYTGAIQHIRSHLSRGTSLATARSPSGLGGIFVSAAGPTEDW
jgi:hypothetical protein